MIQLNQKQEEAKERILKFIYESEDRAIILTGSAGCGKTITIAETMKEFRELERMDKLITPISQPTFWHITATTNKAKQALKNSLPNHEITTIHSLLGLSVYKGSLSQRNSSQVRPNSVLVIDECSMIGKYLKRYIEAIPKDVKIIYVGDQYQLAPVGHKFSPVFFEGYEVLELTQPMRQVNAPKIGAYCEELKQYIKDEGVGTFPQLSLSNEIEHYSGQEFNSIIDRVFITEEQDTNDHRVLAYSNKVVQAHNARLFAAKNGRKHFKVGDTVLVNKYVRGIKTDEQVTITDERRCSNTDYPGTIYTVVGDVVITELYSPDDYNKTLKKLEDVVLSEEKIHTSNDKYLYEYIADLRPLYACTVHKSQGSTYDTVYIDLNPFKYVRDSVEMARLLYVAISRASNKVILTGDIA